MTRIYRSVSVGSLISLVLMLALPLLAHEINAGQAGRAASKALSELTLRATLASVDMCLSVKTPEGHTLARVFPLQPQGFLVLSSDSDLPPIIAYSGMDPLPEPGPELSEFLAFLRTDLLLRTKKGATLSTAVLQQHREHWTRLLSSKRLKSTQRTNLQWPPTGSTSTGGWLESNWHQNAPYNDDCPIDSVTGLRSVAGCPAVAMAMIMNYHRTTNNTVFNDDDDYYHSYSGRNFWIDDDSKTLSFPSFQELTTALAELENLYSHQSPADDAGCAALTFACGTAAQQIYTSSVSGTFGVSQAESAYQKFAVSGAELLHDTDPNLYPRLIWNMKHALPAHLAVENEDHTSGHNVVVDGYIESGYYHLNFGWGGSSNGWYLLPDEIPYGLTVIEGLILDINPSGILFKEGFEGESLAYWSASTKL